MQGKWAVMCMARIEEERVKDVMRLTTDFIEVMFHRVIFQVRVT
jgi:hypothetical protein